MVILGTTTSDEVSATVDDGDWLIESPSGFINNFDVCEVEQPTRVRCPHYNGVLRGELRGGDDTIDLKSRHLRGGVKGGLGDDTLLGNRRGNVLIGGPGADVIRSGAGPDRIYGKGGKDSLFGQRGADMIFANDHRRDSRINCGPGRKDIAFVDRHVDPKPIGCEKVRYKVPPPRELRRLGVDQRYSYELRSAVR